jgi:hypothetical protein
MSIVVCVVLSVMLLNRLFLMWVRWALPDFGKLFFAVVYGLGNLCFSVPVLLF